MKTRQDYLEAFIKKHHLKEIEWLSQDASNRRYARVKKKNKNYILMDSPPSEKTKEFVLVDSILRRHHFFAPKIYNKDLRHGFLLLEDFGNTPLSQAIMKRKSRADDLYILALDTLIKIQKEVKEYKKLPLAYPQMIEEHNLFIEYYVTHILGIKLSQKAKKEFYQIWEKLFRGLRCLPKTIVLYDYHLDNLMLRSDDTLGLLDFQDALQGPVFYDLVSLVEDERFPLPLNKRKAFLEHYFRLRPVLAEKKYRDWLCVVAAHRHTRVIGMFARLAVAYHKPQYLKFIENDWKFLKENIQFPLLNEYRLWLNKYLPKILKDK